MFMCKIGFKDGSKHIIEHFDQLQILSANSVNTITEKEMLSNNFAFNSRILCFSSNNYAFRVNGTDVLYFEIFKAK